MERIDRIDRDIIELLRSNARASYKEIGERVYLSANAVAERIKRLQASGVIRGFSTDLDLAAFELPLAALIDVKLRFDTSADHFEAVIQSIPGVVSAILMTGTHDYQLRVACKDQHDLMRLIESLRMRAGAQDTYSHLILRELAIHSRLGP